MAPWIIPPPMIFLAYLPCLHEGLYIIVNNIMAMHEYLHDACSGSLLSVQIM